MKIAVNIIRVIVGILFIFSGLVKANDPLGLSYKMNEFFDLWGMHRFESWTLILSVLMNAFEIIAGFALLLGWRIKLFSWLLLLLIIFFTFLTGYTYITGNPKNCGCFGDCLVISSKTSFLKDLLLLILIGLIFLKQKLITPLFRDKLNTLIMLGITSFSFIFQWYTLNYLPVVDCLPFKKGNNIVEKTKMPANAIPDSTVITFLYKKDGKEVEFTADKFPADFDTVHYKMVKRFDKLIRKGKNNEPPIKGFVLTDENGTEFTTEVLDQPYAVLLFIEKFSNTGSSWKSRFDKVYKTASGKNIPCYIITADPAKAKDEVKGTTFNNVPVYTCDYKAIETASRSDLTVYLIQKATIVSKYSGKKMREMNEDLEKIPVSSN